MKNLAKILKYTFYDTLRSLWAMIYCLFFFSVTAGLLYFSGDFSQSVASLLNVIIFIVPLVSIVFGTMFFYNSREFAVLLMAHPVKRIHIFLGQYLGLSISMTLSYVLGLLLPFLIFQSSSEGFVLLIMLSVCGALLTFIFSAFALFISTNFDDKVKGFGLAIVIWLFLAVIYDGLFLTFLVIFEDYPLEKAAIGFSIFNPIDLSRIIILLQLETAALLGYTGAVFNKFFGTSLGILTSLGMLILWAIVPLLWFSMRLVKKDF
jgi:Cu-processing system permease protein